MKLNKAADFFFYIVYMVVILFCIKSSDLRLLGIVGIVYLSQIKVALDEINDKL